MLIPVAIPVAAAGLLNPLVAVCAMFASSLMVTGNALRMSGAAQTRQTAAYNPLSPCCAPGLFSMFFYQKHFFLAFFTVFCPLRHVFVTDRLSTPLSDSLLSQAFPKG
ncbi:MAG: hypothetical protein ABSB94_21935, partial [Syntrophorhabdales bacterium]